MADESAQVLRDAASAAHRRGDTDSAVAIFEKILALYPESREAIDAVFYLSSIGKGRLRRPPKRSA
jgi:outer membrane protein assembly factor BamD (BamD/ComL family)